MDLFLNTPYSKMAANELFFCLHVISPLDVILTAKFFCFLYMLSRRSNAKSSFAEFVQKVQDKIELGKY